MIGNQASHAFGGVLQLLFLTWKMFFQFLFWKSCKMEKERCFRAVGEVVERSVTFFPWFQGLDSLEPMDEEMAQGTAVEKGDGGWDALAVRIRTTGNLAAGSRARKWLRLQRQNRGRSAQVCAPGRDDGRAIRSYLTPSRPSRKPGETRPCLRYFCSFMLLTLQWLSCIPAFNKNAFGSNTDLLDLFFMKIGFLPEWIFFTYEETSSTLRQKSAC